MLILFTLLALDTLFPVAYQKSLDLGGKQIGITEIRLCFTTRVQYEWNTRDLLNIFGE